MADAEPSVAQPARTDIQVSKRSFVLFAGALLAVCLVAYSLGTGLIWPHVMEGANEPFPNGHGATLGMAGRPGDHILMLDFFQHRDSGEVLTLESLTPSEPSGPWNVTDLALLVRRPGQPLLTAGAYALDSIDGWRDCEGQAIVEPEGYEVQPGESVMLVEVLTLGKGAGDGKLSSPTIVFRRGGVRYRSRPGMDLEVRVSKDFRHYQEDETWEWACAHPEGTF
ncbi:MAG: hypothetical protein QOG04_2196 [Actinomycetota bacterium]|jgi:hypothetical protein|nr:hypothetical protein [Actinomycetota bacterium]